MRKEFNVTGSCNPQWHYMVNMQKRLETVEALIDKGKYFTINRARQYGKTTMLQTIRPRLSDKYTVTLISLKGFEEKLFQYVRDLAETCHGADKPTALLVDDADEYHDDLLFINFMGFLRNSLLERNRLGANNSFHSVVLVCREDVKNKKVYNANGDLVKNAPWNIAADFNVDMTFHPEEIAQMLGDYEADAHTGMDIRAIYYVEPETRDNRRMDLVVTYERQEFIVELKIWHGDKYEEKGRDQLSAYLQTRGMDEGYLVTFDFSKNRQDTEPQWIDWNGKRIFEVII